MPSQTIMEALLAATGASRTTLRIESPDEMFPVVAEALAPGVSSIVDVRAPHFSRQPVLLEAQTGRQVVQNDCLSASAEPHFREMLELYGGMRAQIVTPIMGEGAVRAIISLHQLGEARTWTEHEKALCNEAAEKVRAQL